MSLQDLGIEHKKLKETLIASIRCTVKDRKELQEVYQKLAQSVGKENIAGPAFAVFYLSTGVYGVEGFDVEAGFPVTQSIQEAEITSKLLPEMEVLSIVHKGPVENIRENSGKLFGYTNAHGLVSDEFFREIYLDSNDPVGNEIEVQFCVHDWNTLLATNVERVLGAEAKQRALQGSNALTPESTLEERNQWVRGAIEQLESVADEHQRYDILSSCAHIFPDVLLEKVKAVYEEAREQTGDPMKAIDAVIAFMDEHPAWPDTPERKGHIIYTTKSPARREAYEQATTDAEKRKAHCYCPIIRNHLETNFPVTFCYCGAGWYRQQWEGAIGKAVPKIELLQCAANNDDGCQFAIHLPEDL
ncbi:MAG: GyrI-like domain-containing protein [Candidatus Thorarchaeota archaeon]